jgi:eukaryotic-like serine/threonine-protein kinase
MTAWFAGTELGPYEILEPIGEGGMGEVWKARDTRLDRIVAIKRLKGTQNSRFQQEARAVAALNHPCICVLYDVGPDYLVMEYIEGRPLNGPLPIADALRLAISIAGAVEAAHGKGILHRDLKPANVLITATGTKLLDFGLARVMVTSEPDALTTLAGTVMGTAAYMSPEQAQGKTLDQRSDIFSFGALLYEMISGCRAFAGESMLDILNAVVRDDPAPLQSPAADIVKQCLVKQPAQRFQSMTEVRTALEQVSTKSVASQPSIAVLPFANMSADKENEYFSDGLSEEIINALTKVAGLKVTARTSAFSFRSKDVEIGEIARKLNVEHVLEGSVRKAGNRIRITAQLIKAADGFHVWSERYDRELIDIFAIQDEISAAIAAQLKVSLTPTGQRQKHTPALAAYEAYLQGLHYRRRMTPHGLLRAQEYLERAVAIDPLYAPAWAGLATCYGQMAHIGQGDTGEMLSKTEDAARKAIALDDSLAHAHALLGGVSAVGDHDWNAAGAHFRRALELEYTVGEASIPYAIWYLRPLGRLEEALAELERLRQRDPLSLVARTESAHVLLMMRRYEACAEMAMQALDLEPNHGFAMFHLVLARLAQKRYEEAVELAERAMATNGRWLIALAHLGIAYATVGRTADARLVLAEMHDLAKQGHAQAGPFGAVYMALGEIDTAVDWVERSIDRHEPIITLLKAWPLFDPIRSHQRYPALLRKLNLT